MTTLGNQKILKANLRKKALLFISIEANNVQEERTRAKKRAQTTRNTSKSNVPVFMRPTVRIPMLMVNIFIHFCVF